MTGRGESGPLPCAVWMSRLFSPRLDVDLPLDRLMAPSQREGLSKPLTLFDVYV